MYLTAEQYAFSRAAETEADESGLAICTRACYDRAGASPPWQNPLPTLIARQMSHGLRRDMWRVPRGAT